VPGTRASPAATTASTISRLQKSTAGPWRGPLAHSTQRLAGTSIARSRFTAGAPSSTRGARQRAAIPSEQAASGWAARTQSSQGRSASGSAPGSKGACAAATPGRVRRSPIASRRNGAIQGQGVRRRIAASLRLDLETRKLAGSFG